MAKQVLVLGGGYAGVMAANRLAARGGREALAVTMVTAQPLFVERIRLHEYAAGTREAPVHSYESLLHPDIRLQIASARRIDAAQRLVEVDPGDVLSYDYMIAAVGSGAARPFQAGAHSLSDLEGAERVAREIDALPARATLAVVGGGLTAIEVAAEIAERHPTLTVQLHTSSQIAPELPASSRDQLRRALVRLGVDLHEHNRVVEHADPRLALGVDLVIRCTGFTVPSLAINSDLPTAADGRLIVDEALTVDGRIFGAGDGAFINNDRYRRHPMGCAAALPMGAHAADNIIRIIAGRCPQPLSAGFVAQCISIGRRGSLVQPVTAADEPHLRPLRGRTGALVKEIICRQTLRWMRGEAKHAGSYSWPKGPKTSTPAAASEQAWI